MKEYLFTYGTLQKVEVQLKLFGRLLKGERDTLRRHKTVPIEIKDKAFLSQGGGKDQLMLIASDDKADSIRGMVFEMLDKELFTADEYEPDGYVRAKVTLESGKQAWVYKQG